MNTRILENIVKNNYKIDFLTTNPYVIFKIDNFLSVEDYNFFRKSFKDVKQNNYVTAKSIKKKFSYNSSEEEYKKHILDNEYANEIHQTIFNEKFVNFFYKKLYFHFFKSRKDDLIYLLKLIRPKIINFDLKNKYSITEKLFFSKISPQIEYSYMFNKAYLDPHVDYVRKLISLMLYFPEEDLNENDKANLGTTFYKSNIENIDSEHLESSEQKKFFFENSEKICQLPFQKQTLYGFIRSKKSWHAVKEFNLRNDFVRKSININFFI